MNTGQDAVGEAGLSDAALSDAALSDAGQIDLAGLPADPAVWVPGGACTLPTADRPLRLAQFDELFATALRGADRVDANRLVLRLLHRPEVAARAADLAVRETGCCGFFTFTLTATGEQLRLEVAVPDNQTAVLDGLAARTTTAGPA